MFDLINALVACGQNLQVATAIDHACKEHRATEDAKKRIAQCCARGVVDVEDFRGIVEGTPGLIAEPAKVRRMVKSRLLWPDFVKEMNLNT